MAQKARPYIQRYLHDEASIDRYNAAFDAVMTIKEVMAEGNLSHSTVKWLILQDDLWAEKRGNLWLISRDSFDKFMNSTNRQEKLDNIKIMRYA